MYDITRSDVHVPQSIDMSYVMHVLMSCKKKKCLKKVFKLPLIIRYPWKNTHVMIVHLFNLVGSHCIVPPCSFLWNMVFWYIPPWSGYNCPVEDWGDTSWFQCFSNRCPLIIRCLEMARAYNSLFTYVQLTVISIEFPYVHMYIWILITMFSYMLFVFVEYHVSLGIYQ